MGGRVNRVAKMRDLFDKKAGQQAPGRRRVASPPLPGFGDAVQRLDVRLRLATKAAAARKGVKAAERKLWAAIRKAQRILDQIQAGDSGQ